MSKRRIIPIAQVLVAALLFGASAPLAKLLLGEVAPIPLAALLYLGSGICILGIKIFQNLRPERERGEGQIERADLPWLAGAVFAGGIAAPIVLLFSLQVTAAATASLLLNFEAVATTLIAALAFKEAIGRRAWLAIALITLASVFLSFNLNGEWGFSPGALGILAACILWGIDNNLTRNVCIKDPLTIVTIKGIGAGSFSLVLALFLGQRFPHPGVIAGALALGGLSYGVSILLFILGMRGMGAARASALFGMAPLAGMAVSLVIFMENPTWLFYIAVPVMLAGAYCLVKEDHCHYHVHGAVDHEHAHTHDDPHHNHVHDPECFGAHAHAHCHEAMAHDHDHLPDTHHRHTHEG